MKEKNFFNCQARWLEKEKEKEKTQAIILNIIK